MPDFSSVAAVLAEVTSDALSFYLDKGKVHYQTVQEKPLIRHMEKHAKDNLTGGSGDISVAIKGAFGAATVNDTLKGYQLDDTLTFYNPTNTKRAAYNWKEMHLGITFTLTEMKADGLVFGEGEMASAVPGAGAPRSFKKLSGREQHALVNMINEKFEDMSEQYARSLNTLLWGDGTADTKALAGIRAFIATDPTVGTVGGFSRATNTWWRNRQLTGTAAIVSDVSNGGNLIRVLKREIRQLRRFGGKPSIALCGIDFLEALENEYRANGTYFTEGPDKGEVDLDVGRVRIGPVRFEYDPTLDDLSLPKRCYIIDPDAVFLMKMPGEWNKVHAPARPFDKMTINRSVTCTGQVVGRRLNSSGVYDIS